MHSAPSQSARPRSFLDRALAQLDARAALTPEIVALHQRALVSARQSQDQAKRSRAHPRQSYAEPDPRAVLAAPERTHYLSGSCGMGASWSSAKAKGVDRLREPDTAEYQARVQRVVLAPSYARPGQIGHEIVSPALAAARARMAQGLLDDAQAEADLAKLSLEAEREARPVRDVTKRRARFTRLT